MRKCCIQRRKAPRLRAQKRMKYEEVVKRTEAHLVFLTLNAGVVRCVMSPGLAPKLSDRTSHREGGDGVPHLLKWPQHRGPSHEMHPLCSEGCFSPPGLRSSLMVDLCWLPQEGSVAIIYVHFKNHSRKYLSHFHDICILLCRDIGLAAKCFSQQKQMSSLVQSGTVERSAFLHHTNKPYKFPGWEKVKIVKVIQAWQYWWELCYQVATL